VLSLEEELSIGGKSEYLFGRLGYLAVDGEENIYAMDQAEAQVKVFDLKGNFLRAIGRKGEGPGELLYPNTLFIIHNKQLVVEDFIRSLNYFSLVGKFIRAQSIAKIFPIGVLLDSSGRVFAITNINDPQKSGRNIELYDENLNFLKGIVSLPRPKPNPQILEPFQQGISWTLSKDDNVVVSFKEEYELDIFNNQGRLIRRILKAYQPVEITEEDVKQRVKKVPEGRKLVVSRYFPAIRSLTADDEGKIFVHTYEKAGTAKYYNDVFDSEGRYVAKVALEDSPKIWKNRKLYSIEEDEEGAQLIKKYQVRWNMK
jgi:hypothetical protein